MNKENNMSIGEFLRDFGDIILSQYLDVWEDVTSDPDCLIIPPPEPPLNAGHYARIYRKRLRVGIPEEQVKFRRKIEEFCACLEEHPAALVNSLVFHGRGVLTIWYFVENKDVIMVDHLPYSGE